ncbi:hypothetical protein PsYK624_168430 [Phanerochaete sordida]|uniref:Uncharacterized protein n=1 Tax=Phanerochaete sordida TaxID=48140 RepID=A0A9P3GXV3_9APHY|nr:hypothetical protein PsYK624_168430 [Phanerochaete sordida]
MGKHKKTRVRKSKAKGGKPGNQGKFKGARLEFLFTLLPDYLALVPTHRFKSFWDRIHPEYWLKFPFWVPLEQDPTPDDLARLEDDVSDEIQARKSEIIKSTNASVKGWFRRQEAKDRRTKAEVFSLLFEALCNPEVIPPRKLPGWQYWMSRNTDKINEEYLRLHPNDADKLAKDIGERCRISRVLWEEADEEQQKVFEAEAQAEFNEEMEHYHTIKSTVTGTLEDTPEAQERARAAFAEIALPFAEFLAKASGTCVSIISGSPPPPGSTQLHLKAVHAGMSVPTATAPSQKWSDYDPEGFKLAIKQFSKFVIHCNPAGYARVETQSQDGGEADGETAEPVQPEVRAEEYRHGKDQEAGDEEEEDEEDDDEDESEDEPLIKKRPRKNTSKNTSKRKQRPQARREQRNVDDAELRDLEAWWKTAELGPHLRASVDALRGQERARRLQDIFATDGFELEREENIARNRAMTLTFGTFPWATPPSTSPSRETSQQQQQPPPPADTRASPPPPPADASGTLAPPSPPPSDMRAPPPPPSLSPSPSPSPSPSSTSPSSVPQPPTSSAPAQPLSSSAPPGQPVLPSSSAPPAQPPLSSTPLQPQSKPKPRPVPKKIPQPPPSQPITSPEAGAAQLQDSGHPTTPLPLLSSQLVRGAAPRALLFHTVNPDGWPEWLDAGYTYLSSAKLGERFERALVAWTEVERQQSFETKGSLPTEGRPSQVGFWMGHQRRVYAKTPPIDDVREFANQWWAWWRGMQPAWRTIDATGRLVRQPIGPWDALQKPGKRGLLLVLLCLQWWAEKAGAIQADWSAAVDDVTWALESMLVEQAAHSDDSHDEQDGLDHANGTVVSLQSRKRRRSEAVPGDDEPVRRSQRGRKPVGSAVVEVGPSKRLRKQ